MKPLVKCGENMNGGNVTEIFLDDVDAVYENTFRFLLQ